VAELSVGGYGVTVVTSHERVAWVLLCYRVPREPSTPRIAVWRKLRRLGVGSLHDGVVALPEDARSREQLEWVADRVVQAGGTASMWRAESLLRQDERQLAEQMADARAAEYAEIADEALAAASDGSVDQSRVAKRLRRQLRDVQRRDYFPPPDRERAVRAVQSLASRQVEGVAR